MTKNINEKIDIAKNKSSSIKKSISNNMEESKNRVKEEIDNYPDKYDEKSIFQKFTDKSFEVYNTIKQDIIEDKNIVAEKVENVFDRTKQEISEDKVKVYNILPESIQEMIVGREDPTSVYGGALV